jgi:hypothetical protein
MAIVKESKYPKLVSVMRENKITYVKLANILGIQPYSVYRKVKGRTDWTISEVETLCELLNKNYYELFK